ncbi:MAG: hypothetical protein JXA82_20015 [Sedimentisphaerales bacterium]|nr:hypothetical protein [Sedimentisphaerales bacterium]
MALDAGWPGPNVTNVSVGGQTLSFHSTDADTLAAIDQGGWDYVVLQEYSTKATDNAGDPNGFKTDATFLYDRVKTSSPNARIILYETWARHEDHDIYPETFIDRDEMQMQVIAHYHDCADNYIPTHSTSPQKTDVRVAPAGEAWHANYHDRNLMLHGSDLYHAGSRGQYLNAMVIYSTIYHRMVAGLHPLLGVNQAETIYLQEICDSVTGETIPQVGDNDPNTIGVGDVIYVDFGPSQTVDTGNWNTMTTADGIITNAVTDSGTVTVVAISFTDRMNGENTNGTESPDPALDLPSQATRDSFYGNDVTWGGRIEDTAQLLLSNLNPSQIYELTIFASRMGVNDNRQTQYAIHGESGLIETLYLNPANNVDTAMTSQMIAPTASGEITIDMRKGPQNNNSYGFYYIGALVIRAYHRGDVNCDGQVQLMDLQTMAENWLTFPGLASWGTGDVTQDGTVDLSDMAELSLYWLTGLSPDIGG